LKIVDVKVEVAHSRIITLMSSEENETSETRSQITKSFEGSLFNKSCGSAESTYVRL
jgi:hypothetical protein